MADHALPRASDPGSRFRRCLLVALLVHLLGLLAVQHWTVGRFTPEVALRVRFEAPPPMRQPRLEPLPAGTLQDDALSLAPQPATTGPPVAVEWDGPGGAAPAPFEGSEGGGALPGGGLLDLSTGVGKGEPLALSTPLPTLNEIQLQSVQRWAEERAQYTAPWLPDDDTTDHDSQQTAEEIVRRAVQAMGGKEALLEVTDMQHQGRYHAIRGPYRKYAEYLPGEARLVYDGEQGWVDVHGEAYALSGPNLREVERRARRWDFLSRYLGDGVRLDYLGSEGEARLRQSQSVIAVEDLKYGTETFRAGFDQETDLLSREEFPSSPGADARFGLRHLRLEYLDYGPVQRARLWQAVGSKLVPGWGRPTVLPVSYDPLPEHLFTLSRPDTGGVRLPAPPDGPQVWVKVVMANRGIGANFRILPASPGALGLSQRNMLRRWILDKAVDELDRKGLFSQVLPTEIPSTLSTSSLSGYLLHIEVHQPSTIPGCPAPTRYFAWLADASGTLLMQDGPPSACYYYQHPKGRGDPGCSEYRIRTMSIDQTAAYLDQKPLLFLLVRTAHKAAASVQAFETGEPLPYLRECCYCRSP